MKVGLLGSLEVVGAKGANLPISGAKLRVLLAVLALDAGRVVPTDRLIDSVWGEDPPGSVRNALQALVSKLRKALGDNGLVDMRGDGYVLELPSDAVDVFRFEQLLVGARQALGDGDKERGLVLFAEADALWRGDALSDFTYDDFAAPVIARLTELRLNAAEECIDVELALGRHAALVPRLEALVTEHPLREGIRGQLMIALYRTGRQADALRVFQDARKILSEELGLDPGPELRRLETAILDHHPSLLVSVVDGGDGTHDSPAERHWKVPTSLSPLVGRDEDSRLVADLCAQHRLVTLVGPGGVGKTRLAIDVTRAVGESMPAGAVMVELAAVTDKPAVRDSIAVALEAHDPDRLAEIIGGRELLILLDNCEHVVEAAAAIVDELLRYCPELRVITTSREALRVEGEVVWPVPPLSQESAAELFVARSSAANPSVAAALEDQLVVDICERLDGLPLAIELAAARTRALPAHQILDRLNDRFRLLTGGARTADPRQQTLRAVVDWSYELLFEFERLVFERIAVFPAGCTLEAAEAVCSDDELDQADVADLVAALVDKSLLVAQLDGTDVRYRMLQTLGDYGRERLIARGDDATVRARMAEHLCLLCDRGDAACRGADQLRWFAEVAAELDNLRAALDWYIEQGDAEHALRITGALGLYWWLTGRASEGCRWLDDAMATIGDSSTESRARCLTWLAYLGYISGRGSDKTVALGEEALEVYRRADDPDGLAFSCFQIALVTIALGDPNRGRELLAETAAHYERLRDDAWNLAQRALVRSYQVWMQNDPHGREEFLRDAADGFAVAGDLWGQALTLLRFGANRAVDGADLSTGRTAFEKAVEIARTLGVASVEGIALARLGNIAVHQGDRALAARLHDEALAIGRRLAYPPLTGFTLNSIAVRLRREGQLDAAEAAAAEAFELYRRGERTDVPEEGVHIDAPEGAALSLHVRGLIAADRNDLTRAEELMTRGLEAAQRTMDPVLIMTTIEGLALAAALRSQGEEAARLLGHAAALREQAHTAYSTFAADTAKARSLAVALLGDESFAAAFDRGHERELGDLMSFSAYL